MVAGIIARLRSFWRGIHRRTDVEAEMTEEFQLHLELRAQDLIRRGIAHDQAVRQARIEFGGTEQYKDKGRESRGLRQVDAVRFSWLDFKLGFRMLVRYPGLTLVGGFAIAFAIWVGAVTFELINQLVDPKLPLADGDRIVALRNWDAEASRPEPRALHDFARWRNELKSVQELGAYRALQRNLAVGTGTGEPIDMAEISASAFGVTRVPPLLGRVLVDVDELRGAPLVAVIGFELWQKRFGGDPDVVGRSVRLANELTTVVGVMPSGFAFPIAQQLWAPLRLNAADYERRKGPGIQIFGRLAPGTTLEEAQAELTTLGQQSVAAFGQTHQHLRPQVMPYAKSFLDLPAWATMQLLSSNIFVMMLLALICANVALLMFARAATREGEIVVRTALGASRSRIIVQLFSEALVLSGVAAIVGLGAAGLGLRLGLGIIAGNVLGEGARLPFWFSSSLSPATLFYAAVLALLCSAIAGVLPALKVTRGLGSRLKATTAGGGGLRFGGSWMAVIITQIAVTVALPGFAFAVRKELVELGSEDLGFLPQQYLAVRLEVDRDVGVVPNDSSPAAFLARFRKTHEALEQQLRAEAAVTGITFADRLPRMQHQWNQIEVDEGAIEPRHGPAHRVSSAKIDASYFDVLGTPIVAGRGFHSGDLAADARSVLVNESFVELVLGGRNPLGRRVRYVASEAARAPEPDGPWYEIVGVARDLGMRSGYGQMGIYHPVAHGGAHPMQIALHVRGEPSAFAPRLRAIAATVDPTLRLYDVMPLDEVINSELDFFRFWFRLVLAVTGIALLLSLAGIYSVMAFTVSRRTHEIGLRIALGAGRRRVVATILKRPLSQVGLGILAGGGLVAAMTRGTSGDITPAEAGLVLCYAVLMTGVCALACIMPARRALSVEPTEALRSNV